MKLPSRIHNPCLATLLRGSGFASMEQFATAVNARAWHMHGVKLAHDHISVRRWLAGGTPQNADAVAAVLSDAWGYHIPVEAIWPDLREGNPPPPAHLQPWVAPRTLEGLSVWTRCDMISRRELLNTSVVAASGAALTDPIARWLTAEPGRLDTAEPDTADLDGARRIGMEAVARIERAAAYFAEVEAADGGGIIREAAVGHLKRAVDLAGHASYSEAVGNRLLAAIGGLAGLIGWLCTDSGLDDPGQRYFSYGLQAARESTDERAPALVVSILSDMAGHARLFGRPDTASRLVDLALDQLAGDRRRHHRLRAMLWGRKALAVSHLGISWLPEVRNAIRLAQDINAGDGGSPDGPEAPRLHRLIDLSDGEIATVASIGYLALAREDRSLAAEAERETLYALANQPAGHDKSEACKAIRLASVRFIAGEPEQACRDAERALDIASRIQESVVVVGWLGKLVADAEPYKDLAEVRELRDRVHMVAAAA